jgi:hypothetical protein
MRGAIRVRRTRWGIVLLCASMMTASGCERTLTQPDAGVPAPDLQSMQEIGTLLRSVTVGLPLGTRIETDGS